MNRKEAKEWATAAIASSSLLLVSKLAATGGGPHLEFASAYAVGVCSEGLWVNLFAASGFAYWDQVEIAMSKWMSISAANYQSLPAFLEEYPGDLDVSLDVWNDFIDIGPLAGLAGVAFPISHPNYAYSIFFNDRFLGDLNTSPWWTTWDETCEVAIHELGHVQGLGHCDVDNIMVQGRSAQTYFGDHEIETDYQTIFGTVYW